MNTDNNTNQKGCGWVGRWLQVRPTFEWKKKGLLFFYCHAAVLSGWGRMRIHHHRCYCFCFCCWRWRYVVQSNEMNIKTKEGERENLKKRMTIEIVRNVGSNLRASDNRSILYFFSLSFSLYYRRCDKRPGFSSPRHTQLPWFFFFFFFPFSLPFKRSGLTRDLGKISVVTVVVVVTKGEEATAVKDDYLPTRPTHKS